MTVNSYLAKSTVVAALGGLLFGFDTAVIAGTTAALRVTYNLSPELLGMTVASALWGTVIGAMLAGSPGEKFGRRDSLRGMAVLYVISALGCAFAWNWPALVVFRFIGGLGIGGSSVLGPMYIAEIAPAKWRGRLVRIFSVQRCFRHFAGIFLQLPDQPGRLRQRGMALGAGCNRDSRNPLLHFAVCDSAQPTLAGGQGVYG